LVSVSVPVVLFFRGWGCLDADEEALAQDAQQPHESRLLYIAVAPF
jgi:hypothetical protein